MIQFSSSLNTRTLYKSARKGPRIHSGYSFLSYTTQFSRLALVHCVSSTYSMSLLWLALFSLGALCHNAGKSSSFGFFLVALCCASFSSGSSWLSQVEHSSTDSPRIQFVRLEQLQCGEGFLAASGSAAQRWLLGCHHRHRAICKCTAVNCREAVQGRTGRRKFLTCHSGL